MKSVTILLFAVLTLTLTGLPAVSGSLCSTYAAIASGETGTALPDPTYANADMNLDDPLPPGKPAAAGVAPQAPTSWRCPQCGFCGERAGRPDRARRGDHRHMMGPRGKRSGPRMGRHGQAAPHGGKRFGGRGGERMGGIAAAKILRHTAELDLNKQQVSQLEELALDARKQMVDLRAVIEKAELELEEQMRSDGDDITTIKKHLNSLAQKRVDVQELKLRNWIAVKKLLTDDQKEMIQEKHPRMGKFLD